MNFDNLTEEDIQTQLAAGSVRGPLQFRGKLLADYTAGLRDLVLKIVSADDTIYFHDFTLVYVLREAHSESREEKLSKRRTLMSATDDRAGFRAMISADFIDSLTEPEIVELRNLAETILTPVEIAQVSLVSTEKKSEAGEPPETPPPIPTPSTSSPLSESLVTAPTPSAGSCP